MVPVDDMLTKNGRPKRYYICSYDSQALHLKNLRLKTTRLCLSRSVAGVFCCLCLSNTSVEIGIHVWCKFAVARVHAGCRNYFLGFDFSVDFFRYNPSAVKFYV